jgi:hypothetical protein
MEWVPVVALLILLVGLGFVVREAVLHSSSRLGGGSTVPLSEAYEPTEVCCLLL